VQLFVPVKNAQILQISSVDIFYVLLHWAVVLFINELLLLSKSRSTSLIIVIRPIFFGYLDYRDYICVMA
jgi:hypothetical protein